MKGKISIQKQKSEEAPKGIIIIPKSKQHVGSVPAPEEPTQEKAPKGTIIIPKSKQKKPEPDLIIEEVPAPTPETPEEVIDVIPEPAPETHIQEQLPEPEPEATPTEQAPAPEQEATPTQEQIPAPEPAPEAHTTEARTRVVRINPQMTQRIEHYRRPTRRERKWEPVTQLGQFFLWIHNNGGLL